MSWETLVVGAVYLVFHRPIHRWFDKWADRLLNGEGEA